MQSTEPIRKPLTEIAGNPRRELTLFRKKAVFVTLISIASVLALLLLWQARFILLLLFAGYIGALILTTLTAKLQTWFHLRRGVAFVMVICVAVGLLAIGVWLRGPALAQQLGALQVDIAAAGRQMSTRLQAYAWVRWVISHSGDSTQISRALSMALSGIGGVVYLTASTIAGLFLVIITSLYLAAEPDFYMRGVRRIIPATGRAKVEVCFAAATRTLRSWLLAKALSMLIIGGLVTVGLLLLRVPLAGTLGAIAGLLTFIPNLGPILSVVPAALLAFAISPTKGFLVIGLFCLVHFLEGNVITPLAERTIVRLPPALTLAVQLLLASIAGLLGIALAAPITAVGLAIADVLLPRETAPGAGESVPAAPAREKYDASVQAS
jgi:predicted PurR-regulated permease PerM